jgi:hypothetical protein
MAQALTGERRQPAVPRIIGDRAGWLWGGHHVIIQSWAGQLAVVALLQDHGAHPAGTGVNWDVIDRPKLRSITEFKGRRNRELELRILVEGWVTAGATVTLAQPKKPTKKPSKPHKPTKHPRAPQHHTGHGYFIETALAALEEMASTPLTVRVIGPVPYWGLRWAITSLEYGDNYLRDVNTGRRMRQELTVHLLEYIRADNLDRLRGSAQPKRVRFYSINRGDDLQKIAHKTLGKASRWQEIAKLNAGMRGVKLPARYKVGARIKVPAR